MKKASEIVMKCLKGRNMSQSEVARHLGEDVRKLNQQLVRSDDMKVGRFVSVLECAGYTIGIQDEGIMRVCSDYVNRIISEKEPKGLYYTFEDGIYIGINNSTGEPWTEEFHTYEECRNWLLDNAEDKESA